MSWLDWALIAVHVPIVYSWAVFPVLLLAASRLSSRKAVEAKADYTPRVAVILSAYNEEDSIRQRLENLLAMDYPRTHWRAYVGVDGSRDRTAAEALDAAHGHDELVVFDFAENRGKVSVLKDLVTRARQADPAAEILVFTDANTDFAADAMRMLCRSFADPTVGGVCGRLVFVRGNGAQTEENVYWRFENWLKAREGSLDSCLGANGAIYAIRSSLFWKEIPGNTIIDDFVIGMKVREQNYRLIYEGGAVAVEELPKQIKDEWKRRVRIGAGNFQAFRLCAPCLSPSYGLFSWVYWSHKVLRWFTPHLMLGGFVLSISAALLSPGWLGLLFLSVYLGALVLMVSGQRLVSGKGRVIQLVRAAQYLLLMQVAIFAGFLRFCRGNLEGRWQRTSRS